MTRVWVTRDESPDGPLANALGDQGLTPVCEPVLETKTVGDAHAEIAALDRDDWLVLTSVRAIHAVAQPAARVPRVAVVGEVSAQIARELGLRVEYVSSSGDSSALWRHIRQHSGDDSKICFPGSSRSLQPSVKGLQMSMPVLYEVRDRAFDDSIIDRIDIAAFASPSAVHSVATRLGPLAIPAASIGPTTSAAIRQAGGQVVTESPDRSFASLARSIAAAFKRA